MGDTPRKSFDAALCLGPIRYLTSDVPQRRASAPHEITDKRLQGGHVPGDVATRLTRRALRERVPYGTIPTEVAAQNMFLYYLMTEVEYTMRQSPQKVSGSEVGDLHSFTSCRFVPAHPNAGPQPRLKAGATQERRL